VRDLAAEARARCVTVVDEVTYNEVLIILHMCVSCLQPPKRVRELEVEAMVHCESGVVYPRVGAFASDHRSV